MLDKNTNTANLFNGNDPKAWLTQHGITEIECLVPDMNGVLRGKALPTAKFLKALED
ncbi:MAG: glutamine synthetase, partial [Mesorhizobium sp.]